LAVVLGTIAIQTVLPYRDLMGVRDLLQEEKSRQPPALHLHVRHATRAFHLQSLAPGCQPYPTLLVSPEMSNISPRLQNGRAC
jgi:hypothetical protein